MKMIFQVQIIDMTVFFPLHKGKGMNLPVLLIAMDK